MPGEPLEHRLRRIRAQGAANRARRRGQGSRVLAEDVDGYELPPLPQGEVVITLANRRGTGGCSVDDLYQHVLPAFKRTDDAEDELYIAGIAFDAGAPGAADRLQAAADEYELAWALRKMVEREIFGIDVV